MSVPTWLCVRYNTLKGFMYGVHLYDPAQNTSATNGIIGPAVASWKEFGVDAAIITYTSRPRPLPKNTYDMVHPRVPRRHLLLLYSSRLRLLGHRFGYSIR